MKASVQHREHRSSGDAILNSVATLCVSAHPGFGLKSRSSRDIVRNSLGWSETGALLATTGY